MKPMSASNYTEKTAMMKRPRHQKDHSDSSMKSDSDSSFDSTESIQTTPGSSSGQEESNSECLLNVDDCPFCDLRVYDNVKPTVAQSYFKLTMNGIRKFWQKQTAYWMLSHEKSLLSSNRF